MMTEALVFAGLSMLIFAAGLVSLAMHRRRVRSTPAEQPDVTFPDRIVASAWRLTPEQWAGLKEPHRISLRKNVASAPGPRRG